MDAIVAAPPAVVAESAAVESLRCAAEIVVAWPLLEIAVLLSEAVVESAEAEPLGLAAALVVVWLPLGIAALPELWV